MLRVYFTSLLLIVLIAASCGQKKRTATDTGNKKTVIPEHFQDLIPGKPIGYTSDFAHRFSPSEVSILDSIISAHKKATTNEIVVVTLDLDNASVPHDGDLDSLSVQIMRHWGVGTKEKNNGVGIVVCPGLKAISIRVGYGLEEKLTNTECRKIIDDLMIPLFKQGEIFEGTRAALEAVINEIK